MEKQKKQKLSRSVFVGNIPYGTTEEELNEIFKQVGPVVSFRLVFDPKTGKPRGYGFCDYYDVETARSAIRNLNNSELGGRQLRVDFAENDGVVVPETDAPSSSFEGTQNPAPSSTPATSTPFPSNPHFPPVPANPHLGHPGMMPPNMGAMPNMVPGGMPMGGPPNMGGPPPNNMQTLEAATESINKTLSSMSSTELYELMSNMKLLVQKDGDQARQILNANPQLSYALMQIMLMLNMVRYEDVQAILVKTTRTNPTAQGNVGPGQPPQGMPNMGPGGMPMGNMGLGGMSMGNMGPGGMPMGGMPPGGMPMGNMGGMPIGGMSMGNMGPGGMPMGGMPMGGMPMGNMGGMPMGGMAMGNMPPGGMPMGNMGPGGMPMGNMGPSGQMGYQDH